MPPTRHAAVFFVVVAQKVEIAPWLRQIKRGGHATGQRLVNGSRLATAAPWPYAAPLRVTYMGEGGYFNSPGAPHNGSALALDEGSGYDPNGDGHAMPYGHADSFWFQAEVAAEAEGAVQSRRAAQADGSCRDCPSR